MTIDFNASEAHFLEHLAPVWRRLQVAGAAGSFFVSPEVVATARRLELEVVVGEPTRHPTRPIAVAAWGDLRRAGRIRKRIVLFEHGAGQSYSNRHSSYAGGRGREYVRLFVVPNEQAAERNRRFYPAIPNAVVGSARVDELRAIGRAATGRRTVALSFHWRCEVVPEAGSAWDHYAAHLEEIRRELEEDELEVIGHAHPRIFEEAAPIYRAAGIEPVRWFPEVVARADLYACDNSSTLFEFAALDRPVVVLNAPWFRKDVEHGLRFWSEASVGLQVEDPRDLSDVIRFAIEDPPEIARVRSESIDRIYPVRDGSSSLLAAYALARLVNRPLCLVCGAAHATCGEPTTVLPVDDLRPAGASMPGLKKYPNPQRKNAFLMLNDRDAKALGLLGQDVGRARVHPAPRAMDDFTHEVAGPPPAEAEILAPPPDQEPAVNVPKGALAPAGPTHRARAKAAKEADAVKDPELEEDAPPVEDPRDKARPAPSSNRRRRRSTPEA